MAQLRKKEKQLNDSGLSCVKRALGDNVFIPTEDIGKMYSQKMLDVSEWTVFQLRAMADFMEANQDMTIFDDGSGKKVRLK